MMRQKPLLPRHFNSLFLFYFAGISCEVREYLKI